MTTEAPPRASSAQISQARQWSAALAEANSLFSPFYGDFEDVFLATGDRLRSLHGQVTTLAQLTDAASAKLSAPEFLDMLLGLDDAKQHIYALGTNRGLLPQQLSAITAGADTIMTRLDALGRTMFHVRVLAINAKVETAQLDTSGVDFNVFTREIAKLSAEGDQTIAAVRHELTLLRNAASAALQLETTFEAESTAGLTEVAHRLGTSIAETHAHQERASQAVCEFSLRLRDAFACVAGIVQDLQIYDITRQRLEHVEKGLVTGGAVIADLEGGLISFDQLRVLINGLAELQAVQLDQAGSHYDHATTALQRALDTMAKGVPAIRRLCELIFSGNSKTEESFLFEVDRDLRRASEIFSRFTEARAQSESALAQVSSAAARAGELVQALNSVDAEMHIIGLNASIKCGNLGHKGRALNVVAHELQAYAKQTQANVVLIADNLDQMVVAATDIAASGRDAGTDTHAPQEALDRAGAALQFTGNEAAVLLDRVHTLSDAVLVLVDQAVRGFATHTRASAMIHDAVGKLNAVTKYSDPGLSGATLEAARREALAFMERDYTMASERDAHARAIQGARLAEFIISAPPPNRGAPDADATPDISDLLF